METNNDKLYGYWVDLSNPLFAATAEGRRMREYLLSIFRIERASNDTPKSRESFVNEMLEKMIPPGYPRNREDLFFALRLAMREQLTCGD
ncbi:MAG: hypothetical protein WCR33_00990 [Bacilli bacterium]